MSGPRLAPSVHNGSKFKTRSRQTEGEHQLVIKLSFFRIFAEISEVVRTFAVTTRRPVAVLLWAMIVPAFVTTKCFAVSPGETAFLEMIDRDAQVFPLWPGDGTPPNHAADPGDEEVQRSGGGSPRIRNVSQPSIVVVPPPRGVPASGTTMLFAPGGGYGVLSLPNAQDLCEWSGAVGAHFVLLKYRVPRSPDDPGRRIPLSDAQRAIRLLRSKAEDLGIDATKIIVAGSSAGGHLAFNLTNNYDEATYGPVDDFDTQSAKPNASLLFYPAYLTKPIESLETDPSLNLDRLGPARTPPVFITVTRPDKFTWGAVDTMLHLRRAKVPSELHVFPDGGHGGMFNKYPLMEFARPAARFLRDQGLFTDSMLTASDTWLDRLESSLPGTR